MAIVTDNDIETPESLQSQLVAAQLEIKSLRQQLMTAIEALSIERQRGYGPRSEKAPGQGDFFDEAEATDPDEGADEPIVDDNTPLTKRSRRKPARKPLPADLPRERVVHDIPEADRQCACGCAMREIGEKTREELDIVPAQVRVIQHVRKTYSCSACDESIQTAPRPPELLPRSIISANTAAYVITAKYADGLPLYRLSTILERYGIELSRQTISEAVLKTAAQIEPLIEVMGERLHTQPVIHMDETRVQVLNEPGKSAQSQSYMWVQRGGPPGSEIVLFTYEPSRSAAVPERLLSNYSGALMSDGYEAYRSVARVRGIEHLCCWAHARRKFMEAKKAQPKGKSGKADLAIGQIGKLYAVERACADSDAATRHRTRQERSAPVLTQLHEWLIKTADAVPPKSAVGKAVHYALEYWAELTRYIENGDWPIDNNPAENAIRPFVIGRKAWMFSNSQRGAKASANLYSLIETAKANGCEPYRYLCWLFERLPSTASDQIATLAPWEMRADVTPGNE